VTLPDTLDAADATARWGSCTKEKRREEKKAKKKKKKIKSLRCGLYLHTGAFANAAGTSFHIASPGVFTQVFAVLDRRRVGFLFFLLLLLLLLLFFSLLLCSLPPLLVLLGLGGVHHRPPLAFFIGQF
jgi:hypothetical protein